MVIKNPETVEAQKQHLRCKDLARIEKVKDKKRDKDDETFMSIIVDMAQVAPCPKAKASEFFYISKLSCYNYSINNLGNSDATCCLWDQTVSSITSQNAFQVK